MSSCSSRRTATSQTDWTSSEAREAFGRPSQIPVVSRGSRDTDRSEPTHVCWTVRPITHQRAFPWQKMGMRDVCKCLYELAADQTVDAPPLAVPPRPFRLGLFGPILFDHRSLWELHPNPPVLEMRPIVHNVFPQNADIDSHTVLVWGPVTVPPACLSRKTTWLLRLRRRPNPERRASPRRPTAVYSPRSPEAFLCPPTPHAEWNSAALTGERRESRYTHRRRQSVGAAPPKGSPH